MDLLNGIISVIPTIGAIQLTPNNCTIDFIQSVSVASAGDMKMSISDMLQISGDPPYTLVLPCQFMKDNPVDLNLVATISLPVFDLQTAGCADEQLIRRLREVCCLEDNYTAAQPTFSRPISLKAHFKWKNADKSEQTVDCIFSNSAYFGSEPIITGISVTAPVAKNGKTIYVGYGRTVTSADYSYPQVQTGKTRISIHLPFCGSVFFCRTHRQRGRFFRAGYEI
jgi:hypothetical protein